MKPNRHPSDETLAAYAAGTLDEGSAFVVAAHLAMCRECRDAVDDFEAIGGVLLADAGAENLGRALDGAVMQELAAPVARAPRLPLAPGETPVDRLISIYGQRRWVWCGFGVSSAAVDVPVQDGVRVFLLKAAAGTQMPQHTHSGVERTLVLKGAFEHELGRFAAGDIEEADGETDHRPRVDASSECVCLVAMSGKLLLPGVLGKLMQPFVRI